MVTTGVPRKSAHCPHSAVKWPHLVRKKSGYEILSIFEHILLYERTKLPKLILEPKYFVILCNFDVFKIAISLIKNIAMLKFV